MRRLLLGGTALVAILLEMSFFGQASAQEISTNEVTVLDRITITGRKRTELEVDAPVSVTVLTDEQVPVAALDPGGEIARRSPTASFTDYSRFGEAFMNMRGIATLGSPLNTLDTSVGFSVDGVPTSTSGFAPVLMDVEQIEVLRGPQGTTFGRNALGGAINVVNNPADGTRDFRVNTELGTDGHAFIEGIAGGWIIPESVAGRGVVRLQKYDGDIPNVILDEDLGSAEIGAARGSLRFTPDDSWTIDVTGSWSREERSNPAYLWLQAPNFPVSGEDVRPENLRTIGQGMVNIRKEFESATFTSTTSYQDIDISNYGDFTDALLYGQLAPLYGLPPEIFADPTFDKVSTDEHERLFTQEFRLNSAEDAEWQWVAGGSYFRSDYDFHRQAQTIAFPTVNGTFDNHIVSNTFAAFGDVTVPLGERWKISGGLRLAHDRQSFDGNYVGNGYPGTVPSLAQEGEFSDTYLTGRTALSYEWTDDIVSYASLARGYSSGGFEKTTQYAPYGVVASSFRPAKGWTYELGTKAQVTDRVRLNGAVFYNDVSDGQLSGFDLTTMQVFLTNQDFRSYGFEASVAVELLDGLELAGGVGYVHSEMVDVSASSMLAGAAEGNAVPQVPTWTGNIGLHYRVPGEAIGVSGEFSADVDYQYVGVRFADLANQEKLAAYHIVNARIGWENDNFGIYAFGRNLLDERPIYFQADFAPGVTGAYVGAGRVLGLGATYKW
jgi:iron complex outermembrane receptor protein